MTPPETGSSSPVQGAPRGATPPARANRDDATAGTVNATRSRRDLGWLASARRHLASSYSGMNVRRLDARHSHDIERLLALARVALGLSLMIAIDSGHEQMHPPIAHIAGAVFVAYAAAIAVLVWKKTSQLQARLLHLGDLGWATLLTAVSGGTSSHAYPFFVFVILAGGYRWGLARSLLDGAVIVVLACLLAAPAVFGLTPWAFEHDIFVMRVSYTAIVAVLLGALAERQLVLSGQAAALASVVAHIGRLPTLASAVREALDWTLRLLDAHQAFLVVEEFDTRRTFLWHARRDGGATEASYGELLPEDRAPWLPLLPDGVCAGYARRRPGSAAPVPVSLALDVEGNQRATPLTIDEPLAGAWPWQSLMFVAFGDREEGMGRLYVVDLDRRPFLDAWLRFLQAITRQLNPLLTSRYILRRVRARIGSRERQRVSLELHDSLVQSLVGLEMRLDVLVRHTPFGDAGCAACAEEIGEIRGVLHNEILGVRDLMQRLQPVVVDAPRLSQELQAVAERFTRATGIAVRLDWVVPTLDLSPQACREVVRIVQEALVNVRRHSGASHAVVRVEADASGWGLIVEDDGQGLAATGRFPHDHADAARLAPRVIRERVIALGGTLTLVSSPGGLRLEMAFPLPQE